MTPLDHAILSATDGAVILYLIARLTWGWRL